MSAVPYMERSTQPQRDFIRTLLARCELSTDRFTYMHRPVFKDARLPEPAFNASVDVCLRDLDQAEASRLIDALKQQAGVEDEEDD